MLVYLYSLFRESILEDSQNNYFHIEKLASFLASGRGGLGTKLHKQ